jgi:hypothetical protein
MQATDSKEYAPLHYAEFGGHVATAQELRGNSTKTKRRKVT